MSLWMCGELAVHCCDSQAGTRGWGRAKGFQVRSTISTHGPDTPQVLALLPLLRIVACMTPAGGGGADLQTGGGGHVQSRRHEKTTVSARDGWRSVTSGGGALSRARSRDLPLARPRFRSSPAGPA
jgi:hypothetical protein